MTDHWHHPVRIVALAGATIVAGFVVWKLQNLLLMLFGALLVALILDGLACLIHHYVGPSRRWALVIAVSVIFALVVGFGALLGAQIAAEITQLLSRAPELIASIERQFGVDELERWVADQLRGMLGDGSIFSDLTGISTFLAAALVNVLVVVAGGIFIAARPGLYRAGLLKLIPQDGREEADEALSNIAAALRLWLVGQLVSMLVVGALTTAGLLALSVPSAFALGFLAGVLEFVPYVGPVISTVPAVAVGFAESPTTAAWVLGLYILVQQLEAALIMPLIQRRAVDLPPALTIFSVLGFGIVLGPWGVVFGAPLTVVAFVLVKKLWVRETLGEPTSIPGEDTG